MAIGLQRLQELKTKHEHAKADLLKARREGDLNRIDQARAAVDETEVAYHDAIYGQAQGFAGQDRTPAAVTMRDDHDIQWNQDREQAVEDWREARSQLEEREDPDLEWREVESYQAAQKRVQEFYGPDAGEWDWEPDPDLGRDSRGR